MLSMNMEVKDCYVSFLLFLSFMHDHNYFFKIDRISNITLRDCTQQLPASRLAAQRQMRWYGHVKRLPPITLHT